MTNFQRTASWLKACGKEVGNPQHISVQIGVHIEEFCEFMRTLNYDLDEDAKTVADSAVNILSFISTAIKKGEINATIADRLAALDALCDCEVTGNGVAYLMGTDKDGADQEVLRSNDSKLNPDGTAVILPGGKIGKSSQYQAPELETFI